MDFSPIVETIINAVAGIIATILIPALMAVLVKWMQGKGIQIKAAQQEQLTALAQEGVMVASQLAKNQVVSKDRRKNVAVDHLAQRAAMVGIKITSDVAGHMVEGAVNRLKREREAAASAIIHTIVDSK